MAMDLDHIDFGPGPDEDFVPYYAGREDCAPGHAWRGVRDHFLVHLVVRGRGSARLPAGGAELGPGQGFLICPGEVARYVADAEEPWSYAWIGFSGRRAREVLRSMGLSEGTPFFDHGAPERLAARMRGLEECLRGEAPPPPAPAPRGGAALTRALASSGSLALCLSALAAGLPPAPSAAGRKAAGLYLDAVMEWVRRNYSRPVRVADLAERVGLDRKYLATLCKERLGRSPKELLLEFRMERAAELLRSGRLSVREVAASVGYADQLAFSKAFKARRGAAPREYAGAG